MVGDNGNGPHKYPMVIRIESCSTSAVLFPAIIIQADFLAVNCAQSVIIAQWANECISLSVLSMARVMIAQWENECISLSVLSVAGVQFPTVVEYFGGFFPGWSHSANPFWVSVTGYGSISPQQHHMDTKEEGRSLTTNRQWLKKMMYFPESLLICMMYTLFLQIVSWQSLMNTSRVG